MSNSTDEKESAMWSSICVAMNVGRQLGSRLRNSLACLIRGNGSASISARSASTNSSSSSYQTSASLV